MRDLRHRTLNWLCPIGRRPWLEAMLAEAGWIEAPLGRFRWLVGVTAAVAILRWQNRDRSFALNIALLLAFFTALDWLRAEPAATIALLGLAACLTARCWPGRWPACGVLLGSWLLIAHGIADHVAALRPFYQSQPLSGYDYGVIASLVAVTLPSAALGAAASRLRLPRLRSF